MVSGRLTPQTTTKRCTASAMSIENAGAATPTSENRTVARVIRGPSTSSWPAFKSENSFDCYAVVLRYVYGQNPAASQVIRRTMLIGFLARAVCTRAMCQNEIYSIPCSAPETGPATTLAQIVFSAVAAQSRSDSLFLSRACKVSILHTPRAEDATLP